VTGKITRLGVSSNGKIVRNFAPVGRVLEHHSKRRSFAITVSTGHKEYVRKWASIARSRHRAGGKSGPAFRPDTHAGEVREVQFFERAGRVQLEPAPFAGRPFADEGSAAIDGNRSWLGTRGRRAINTALGLTGDPHSRSLWWLRVRLWRSMCCAGGDGARSALRTIFCDGGADRRRVMNGGTRRKSGRCCRASPPGDDRRHAEMGGRRLCQLPEIAATLVVLRATERGPGRRRVSAAGAHRAAPRVD
jgi:hypothetical protein